MARSIHTTRRTLADHEAADQADRAAHRAETARLRDELARKRLIKAQVAAARGPAVPAEAPLDPAAITIVVKDHGPYVHHAVTAADVRGVIARLPPGAADGLGAIVLGRTRDVDDDDDPERDGGDERDPYTGAPGLRVLPGVYAKRILGTYTPGRAEILLGAYAYDATTLAEARAKRLLLKLWALATLVHELGHHHDYVARVARGRWRADELAKVERYAEARTHADVTSAVLPYLAEAHAAEVEHLRGWLRTHGGLDAPLAALIDDPRTMLADGTRAFRWTISDALVALFEDVEAGRDPIATRVGFARELHYRGDYALPRAILADVLADHPDDVDALTMLADVEVHEGASAEAEARCRGVLARAPRHGEAWVVLTDALVDRQRWAEVVATTTAALAAATHAALDLAHIVRYRARANLELGAFAAVEHDLRGLALSRAGTRAIVTWLQALLLLRTDQLAAALDLAQHSRVVASMRIELDAVQLEAAMRLGQPAHAVPLSRRDVARLERHGHGAWLARLRAAYPDHVAAET
ncbi:MAG: hypothetical protein JNK64_13535 [Myxococcales bacterium]|nr:hypothetical protein [Myxococcales bacterium]